MNKKIITIFVISAVVSIIFAVLAFISMVLGLRHIALYKDFESVLPLLYDFFHLCIVVAASVFAIQGIKKYRSVILRTIMYVNDYREMQPSLAAKIVSLILSFVGLASGVYFGLTFLLNGIPLVFPYALRLVLVNVGFYLFIMGVLFFVFPYVYDIRYDIEKKKQKLKQKSNGGEEKDEIQ